MRLDEVESPNLGVVVTQDFDITAAQNLLLNGDRLSFGTGLRYEHVEINHGNNGYNVLSSVIFPTDGTVPTEAADVDTKTGLAPTPDDILGGYVLAKYGFLGRQSVNAGLRMDKASRNGNLDFTFRGGYVGTFFDKLTVKLLYGQAVFQPGPYELERASSALLDERSQTAETHASFVLPWLALSADGYYVHYTNPIVAASAFQFANLDKREIVGMDLGARLLLQPFKVPLQIWGYYSRIFLAEDTDSSGTTLSVGDLALDKGWAGATFDMWPVTVTLLSRFIGAREPVSTNPTGTIPFYAVLDANARLSDIPFRGMWFALRVSNIIGSSYSHPGLQTAGSGSTQGVLNGTTWTGSLDDFNSRLPQPGRGFYGTIGLTFEPAKAVGHAGK